MPVEIDIEHVARLARLALTRREKRAARAQLAVILEHAAKVGEVDHRGRPADRTRRSRDRTSFAPTCPSRPCRTHEALANAPEQEDDRFKVPRIAEIGVTELCDLTATELAAELRAGETSSAEITASCLARIDAVDDRVGAFLTRDRTTSRASRPRPPSTTAS